MNKVVGAGFLCGLAVFAAWYGPVYGSIFLLIALVAGLDKSIARTGANATVFFLLISLLSRCISYLSTWYNDIIRFIFGFIKNYDVETVILKFNVFYYISSIIGFASFVLMLIFVMKGLKGEEVKFPIVGKYTDKFLAD